MLPVEYHANKSARMTADTFTTFMHALDCKTGTLCRKILLFLNNCAAHSQEVSFFRYIKDVSFLPNYTSVFQLLDMGVIKSFMHYSQSGNEDECTSSCSLHYNSMEEANCFAKCGVSYETPSSRVEENDPKFDDDSKNLDKINDFNMCASCDKEVVTCGIQSIESLCDTTQYVKYSSGEEPDSESTAQTDCPNIFRNTHCTSNI
ncbi:hypothetical protein PR048_001244 [Dryococelus australis]|uniref:DDE-1 domain-containing protein n=1 Tax=Dryococelus australis TaxID=614101 RepID=A0ABQ9IGY8_9NEOP|nr:hypothetical protein PR048_001244 [Dryococelus australis]